MSNVLYVVKNLCQFTVLPRCFYHTTHNSKVNHFVLTNQRKRTQWINVRLIWLSVAVVVAVIRCLMSVILRFVGKSNWPPSTGSVECFCPNDIRLFRSLPRSIHHCRTGSCTDRLLLPGCWPFVEEEKGATSWWSGGPERRGDWCCWCWWWSLWLRLWRVEKKKSFFRSNWTTVTLAQWRRT